VTARRDLARRVGELEVQVAGLTASAEFWQRAYVGELHLEEHMTVAHFKATGEVWDLFGMRRQAAECLAVREAEVTVAKAFARHRHPTGRGDVDG
jgi:catechol-2,3-dioxygenase